MVDARERQSGLLRAHGIGNRRRAGRRRHAIGVVLTPVLRRRVLARAGRQQRRLRVLVGVLMLMLVLMLVLVLMRVLVRVRVRVRRGHRLGRRGLAGGHMWLIIHLVSS